MILIGPLELEQYNHSSEFDIKILHMILCCITCIYFFHPSTLPDNFLEESIGVDVEGGITDDGKDSLQ